MTSAPHPGEQMLARFNRIRTRTKCSYARATRLLGVAAVDGSETGLGALSRALAGLGRIARTQRPDGVVYEIPDPAAGVTVDVLRRTTGDLAAEVKTTIRVAYAEAGRPYDLALTLSPREADRD